MKRIAIMQGYCSFTPNPEDFVKHKAIILMNRMFFMYVLKNEKVEMLHPFQLEDAARMKRASTGISNILVSYIKNIPEDLWKDIINMLKLDQ